MLLSVAKLCSLWEQSVVGNPRPYLLVSPKLCRQLDELIAAARDLLETVKRETL